MKFEVKNRFSGEVQFVAQITCAKDEDTSVMLGLAVRWGIENKANLDGANLYGANLTRANLDGANLTRANLDGANLYGANLDGANLYGANLTRANLYGANLTRANLYGANLTRANLYGANLYGANLDGANLDGANLDGANLDGAKGINVRYLMTDIWLVHMQDDFIKIGCQRHLATVWWKFTDAEIGDMHSKALAWWKVWKPIIKAVQKTLPVVAKKKELKS